MASYRLKETLASAVLLAGCVHQPPSAQQPQLSWEEYTRAYPDTFISSRDQSQAAGAAFLVQNGLAEELAAMRVLVDQYLPVKQYTLHATGATPEILRRQDVEAVAQYLVEIGYRRCHVANEAYAAELIGSAARLVTGPTGEGDSARVAPTIVLAEVTGVVQEAPDSRGSRSMSILYRIVEPLKNAPPAGTVIRVPGFGSINPAGTESATAADLENRRPGGYVLFLSRPRYLLGRTEPAPVHTYRRVLSNLRPLGDRYVPTGDSDQPEITLEELRRQVVEDRALRVSPGKSNLDQPCPL